MSALTKGRITPKKEGIFRTAAVAANAILYAGAIGCVNSSGRAVAATETTGLKCLGVVAKNRALKGTSNAKGREVWDATGLSNGAFDVEFEEGVFRFANGDSIAATDKFKVCYVVDDQTVAKGSNSGARSICGIIMDVDSDGVWVLMSAGLGRLLVALTAANAYTKTYSTADRTVAAPTYTALTGAGGGTADGALEDEGTLSTGGGNTYTDAAVNAVLGKIKNNIAELAAKVLALAADDLDNRRSIVALVTDLQAAGIVG